MCDDLFFLPIIAVVIFGAIFLMDRAKGGYKAVKLGAEEPEEGEAPPTPMAEEE